MWGRYGESPFDADAVGYLANRERGRVAISLALYHIALEALDTLLVAFDDFIVHRHVVASLERGEGVGGG